MRRAGSDTLSVRAGDLSEAQHISPSTILNLPQVYLIYPSGAC
ncbi:hypothetical protein [Hymenobacter ginkgonis]|nr:hypothetical protein [Hymenobacter ginkgonis]